ncbi:hypothetical protein DFH06DRAFT_1296439 [Mycena polygramma]|nr:hypothetical protein DFH06DRAFT_1296439 [Mycena polygramma]
MAANFSPFLPAELEREIIETTAARYPESISNLFLVSHRACGWMERVRYKVVTPKGTLFTCGLLLLQRLIQSNAKPPYFFRDLVKHMWLEDLYDGDLEEFLSVCSGIHSLTLAQGIQLNPHLAAIRPRRLNLFLGDLLHGIEIPRPPHPMFTFVTHLGLFDGFLTLEMTDHLSLLPVLTHLSIWHGSASPTDVLARCPKLEALIDMNYTSIADGPRSVDDARVVYMRLPSDQYEEDWVIGNGERLCPVRAAGLRTQMGLRREGPMTLILLRLVWRMESCDFLD